MIIAKFIKKSAICVAVLGAAAAYFTQDVPDQPQVATYGQVPPPPVDMGRIFAAAPR